MQRATCPECGYVVGLGTASEPGDCPICRLPLVLTCEFRALSPDDVVTATEQQDAEPPPGECRRGETTRVV